MFPMEVRQFYREGYTIVIRTHLWRTSIMTKEMIRGSLSLQKIFDLLHPSTSLAFYPAFQEHKIGASVMGKQSIQRLLFQLREPFFFIILNILVVSEVLFSRWRRNTPNAQY